MERLKGIAPAVHALLDRTALRVPLMSTFFPLQLTTFTIGCLSALARRAGIFVGHVFSETKRRFSHYNHSERMAPH